MSVFSEDVDECRRAYYEGDSLMLFEAIRRCAQYGLTLPDWIRFELEAGLNRYKGAEAKEFGEAFGVTREKGFHQNAARERQRKAFPIYLEVQRRHEEGEPIDESMFAQVGALFCISGSRAKGFYYEVAQSFQKNE